jgi:hypothetical protein
MDPLFLESKGGSKNGEEKAERDSGAQKDASSGGNVLALLQSVEPGHQREQALEIQRALSRIDAILEVLTCFPQCRRF